VCLRHIYYTYAHTHGIRPARHRHTDTQTHRQSIRWSDGEHTHSLSYSFSSLCTHTNSFSYSFLIVDAYKRFLLYIHCLQPRSASCNRGLQAATEVCRLQQRSASCNRACNRGLSYMYITCNRGLQAATEPATEASLTCTLLAFLAMPF
jgi:hypothetical protein